ncbi:MAG: hypothetical protein MSB11_11500 [Prevotella sp.]|nr:hypothetical protein [Prevotella sp.]
MIELLKKELVYDIKNTAYTYADSISSSVTDLHLIHNIYDVGEVGNLDKLARILDSAVEDCKEMLFRYTKMEMLGSGFDSNEWEECIGSPTNEEEAYYLALRMPKGFSSTSVHTMTVYIHDYIVNQALYEWLMVVYPEGADRFWALAEEKKEKIKNASNRSAVRARIRLHPF